MDDRDIQIAYDSLAEDYRLEKSRSYVRWMCLSPQKLSRWKTLNSLSFLHWRYPGPVLGKLQLVFSNFVTGQLELGTDKGESES